jgi:hypothetical protein
MDIRKMKEGEGASNHDREAKGQNTIFGNAETDSNGRKVIGEKEKLIEIVRILKIQV